MTEEQRRRLQVLNNFRATSPLKVTTAAPQNLNVGDKVITPSTTLRTSVAPTAPKTSVIDRVRDVVDANTLSDQYRRQMQGRAAIDQDAGNIITKVGELSGLKPFGQGIARLLPGGQNDIRALEESQRTNDDAINTYSKLYREGKMSRERYTNALAGLGRNSAANQTEADRIGNTADRSQFLGSAVQVAAMPFTGAGFGAKTLGAKIAGEAGIGAGFGLANEFSTNRDPTLKGAIINTAVGGTIGAAVPLASAGFSRIVKGKPIVDQSIIDFLQKETDPDAIKATLQVLYGDFKGIEKQARALASSSDGKFIMNQLGSLPVKAGGAAVLGAAIGDTASRRKYGVSPLTGEVAPEPKVRPKTDAPAPDTGMDFGTQSPQTIPMSSRIDDIEQRVPRGEVVDVDPITDRKIGELMDAADTTPRPEGTTRVFQTGSDQGYTEWAFTDIDSLARWLNNRADDATPVRFTDVPNAQLQATNRGDNVVTIKQPETPPAPTTQAQTVEQAVEQAADSPLVADNPQATAAIQATDIAQAADNAQTPAPAIGAVEGATDASVVPGAVNMTPDQMAAEAVSAAEQAKGRYGKYSKVQKIKDALDPRNRAITIDRAAAKAQGIDRRDLPAEESLDALIERTTQSKQIADQMLKGSNIETVIKATGGNKEAAQNFNLYRLFKRDLEQRADGRPALNVDSNGQPFNVEDMQRFVADYDARFPEADSALRGMVRDVQAAQDWAVSQGVVPGDEVARARLKKDGSQYEYYTPATRALPEEKIGPSIAASNVGTLGRQKVLQDFTGSMIPVDPSFNSVTDYIETIVRQANQAKVSQKYAERVQQGFIPEANIIQTGDEASRLKQLKSLQKELRETEASLEKAAKRTRGTMRVARAGNQKARTAELSQRVEDLKSDIAALESVKKNVAQQIYELKPDPFTGQQTILGRDVNGNPFRIEVPPEDANLLQGFNNENINDLLKLSGTLQRPFREAFTGILNLPFQIAQATFNAFMLPITSREGIKVFAPRSIAASLKSINLNNDFQQALSKSGAIRYSGGYNQLPRDQVSDAIAAQATKLGQIKWYANPKRAWNQISQLGGRLDIAARTAAADAVKRESLRNGRTYEQAIADAAYEYNNALPNFANASSFVKGLDNAVMYVNPSISGTRTLFRVARENPVKTSAKVAAGAMGITGVMAYSLAQDNGQEFYADMTRANKQYILDNNVIIVLPGARKDPKTGEWSGIVKIPLAPEMRPVNKAIRQGFDPANTGQDGKTYARAMFDFLTGQISSSSNPVANVVAGIATGKDPRSGYDIYDETLSPEDKREAIQKYLIGSFGTVGRQIAGESDKTVVDTLRDKVYGAKGLSEGGEFYKRQGDAIKEVGLNKNELDAYRGTVSPTSKDLAGNRIKEKTYYDSASKALTWLRYPKTFEVSKRIDAENRKNGKPGDPLFDLSPEQRKVILNLQVNYSPGNKEEKAISKLNPWITEFYAKRSAYYDQIKSTLKPEDQKKFGVDPAGITTPTASKPVQDRMNYAQTLTDAKARAAIYREPEVADYLADQNAYQRSKRAFLGLPQFDEYPTPAPEVQKYMDAYSALPKGNGPPKRDGTPSSPDRSAWIKSHPNEWAAMSAAFDKIGAWTAADEGSLAVYEGINAEGDAAPEATPTGDSGGGYSFGGKNYKYDTNGNIVEDTVKQSLSKYTTGALKLPSMPELKGDRTKVVPFKIKVPKSPGNNRRLKLKL